MKQIRCWLLGHRWQHVRIVKETDITGTDQGGNVAYVARTAEWQIRCARCRAVSPIVHRDLEATQLLPKTQA